jgi:hypothetical protein
MVSGLMAAYSIPSYTMGLHALWKSAVALDLPLESSLFQLFVTFPFNVIMAMAAVLVVGTVLAFTRKPARSNIPVVDAESQTTPKDGGEEPEFTRKDYMENHPAQVVEEEIPRSFEGNKDGIVKLYNWFYRFAQWKLGGIANNMTPMEFMSIVSSRIPSEGAPALKYLVMSFEIAQYSKINPTKKILFKCSKGVEILKDLIEGGGSHVSDDIAVLDEASLTLSAHNA